MQGGTLQRWGGAPHNPPEMGGVAPLVERFEAMPPLRSPNVDVLSSLECIKTLIRLDIKRLVLECPLVGTCPVGPPVQVHNIL